MPLEEAQQAKEQAEKAAMAEQLAATADKFTQSAQDEPNIGAELAGKVGAGVQQLKQAGIV